ncbi:hypothetical protein EV130_101158 [Rhizobium azibense]|uniref:Uncharacterized protein n=1 Tax=Rhizobium azibense TaxID=1136135 RepID=A0A4R3R8X6_9HYPH|nr:hypothetical protein EV130_101158 [Rhizobium azibense]TCU41402.1 hypothetical protein EV129_101693 [Rhizobium azibense]
MLVLCRTPEHFREHGARCIECPDFFRTRRPVRDGDGFRRLHEPATGRQNFLRSAISKTTASRRCQQSCRNWTSAPTSMRCRVSGRESDKLFLPSPLVLTMMPEAGYQRLRAGALPQSSPFQFDRQPSQVIELSMGGDLDGIRSSGKDRANFPTFLAAAIQHDFPYGVISPLPEPTPGSIPRPADRHPRSEGLS